MGIALEGPWHREPPESSLSGWALAIRLCAYCKVVRLAHIVTKPRARASPLNRSAPGCLPTVRLAAHYISPIRSRRAEASQDGGTQSEDTAGTRQGQGEGKARTSSENKTTMDFEPAFADA